MIRQALRFGLVGGLAAGAHLATLGFLESLGIAALVANIAAFLCAFQVSFLGHHHWTFRGHSDTGRDYARLFAVACAGFALNEGLFALLLQLMNELRIVRSVRHDIAAQTIVQGIVAVIVFTLARWWAFRRKTEGNAAR